MLTGIPKTLRGVPKIKAWATMSQLFFCTVRTVTVRTIHICKTFCIFLYRFVPDMPVDSGDFQRGLEWNPRGHSGGHCGQIAVYR